MSRICAEYTEEDLALEAARKLSDQGVDPQDIEIRSPYPMAELAIPPHRQRKMTMRNTVRLLWACGFLGGFSFLTWTQLWWDLKTDWHPVVSIPINSVITYECGMLVALLTTTFMFFWETRHSRRLTPPLEEDLPVAHGHVVVLVDGDGVEKAEGILQGTGYKSLVHYALLVGAVGVLATSSGCGKYRTLDWNKHNMRDQQVIKPTEAAGGGLVAGTLPMPSRLQQEVHPLAPHGWVGLSDPADPKFKYSQPSPEVRAAVNPVKADAVSLGNGRRLFEQNCASCHGVEGKGDGKVGEVYAPMPANLTANPAIVKKGDGDFYHWILVGKNTMPTFGHRLATVEIFDIVNYLRHLQAGGGVDSVEPAVRKGQFKMAAADLQESSPMARVEAPLPALVEAPAPEATPDPAPEPEASPAAAAPAAQASAEQLAAAGFTPAAHEMPGAAEVALMELEVPAALVEQGREIYVNAGQCASCHGDGGAGDGPAGAGLEPAPRNLTAKGEYLYGTSDKALYRTIAHGVPGTGMAAQGESAGGALTEEQVKAVTAYVRSLMK